MAVAEEESLGHSGAGGAALARSFDPVGPEGSEPGDLRALEAGLAQAARHTWPQLPVADVDAAVEAGVLAAATAGAALHQHTQTDGNPARGTAVEVGAAAAALQRQGLPPTATTPVDWSAFGTVIPVLAGSPGAGASVLTTLLADVLQLSRQRVLVVDAADPPRSGLAIAARSDGSWVAHPHSKVRIRFSWRAQALLARVETSLPVVAPGMVPPPRFWQPPVERLHATVVDIGHDPWRVATHPLAGVGGWLRRGTPSPRPVLVVRPSRPSLLHAEQILARLEPWVVSAAACAPVQLVVMSAKQWPSGVAGSAGRRVATLVPDAVFVPHDRDLAAAGITAAVTPTRLRQTIRPLLRRWGLLPDDNGKGRRSMPRGN